MTCRTIQAYAAHAKTYLRHWGNRRYRQPRLLRECVHQLVPPAGILDLGCGPGQDARHLFHLHRGRARYRVVAVDLSWLLLEYARRRSRRLPLVQADMRRLPFRRAAFDAVWAAASLIHLPKHMVRRTLRSLLEVVRPGGILGATLVHGRRSGYVSTGWIPGRFISRWRKAELARAVSRAGWQIVRLETVMNRERKGRWLNLLARRPCP
jgi:SAM-dependent methyltransferase